MVVMKDARHRHTSVTSYRPNCCGCVGRTVRVLVKMPANIREGCHGSCRLSDRKSISGICSRQQFHLSVRLVARCVTQSDCRRRIHFDYFFFLGDQPQFRCRQQGDRSLSAATYRLSCSVLYMSRPILQGEPTSPQPPLMERAKPTHQHIKIRIAAKGWEGEQQAVVGWY